MESEDYVMVIHWLSILLMLGSVAEIYVRKKGLGVREDRHRDGRIDSNKQSVVPPIILLLVSAVITIMTRPG